MFIWCELKCRKAKRRRYSVLDAGKQIVLEGILEITMGMSMRRHQGTGRNHNIKKKVDIPVTGRGGP
jgi:hypothetical protein